MKACVLVNWAIIRYLQQLKLKKKILKMAMMKEGFDIICVFDVGDGCVVDEI